MYGCIHQPLCMNINHTLWYTHHCLQGHTSLCGDTPHPFWHISHHLRYTTYYLRGHEYWHYKNIYRIPCVTYLRLYSWGNLLFVIFRRTVAVTTAVWRRTNTAVRWSVTALPPGALTFTTPPSVYVSHSGFSTQLYGSLLPPHRISCVARNNRGILPMTMNNQAHWVPEES
jgi:hypothetical protein